MSEPRPVQLSILQDAPRLGPEDAFTFRCDPSLACFTRCCADVAIVLTPYDVLRMKRALGLSSAEFLERYTISPFTPEQKVPTVLLKMNPADKRCPFVGGEGCRIYPHRPWACRMYPLGLAAPDKPTPADRAFYFLMREEICEGHRAERTWTVRQWIQDQGLEEYDMMGASFRELMLDPFWDSGQALAPNQVDMYYMACYDLDRFRRFVFQSRLLELFEVDEARVEALRSDDLELLEFAMGWLKFCLLHQKTMKIKPAVAEARRQALRESGALQ
jgi:Fe-S-cluster containining protein